MPLKRFTQFAAVTSISALALTSCGGEGGNDDGDVALTFTWWGSDSRHAATEEIIEAFEAENPGITIDSQFSDWDGYWDQLATQSAGGDAPDIIQMDQDYLREYADRGALLELTDVDTSELDESAIEAGRTDDQGLVGISTGVNAMVLMANTEIFDEASVELPDDTSWTWEDYYEITAEISENADGIYGATGPGQPADLQMWLRQQGKHLTTDEGELGFDTADAAEYFDHLHHLMETGGYPNASVIAEDQTPGPDESMTGSNEVAMGMWWTNQLPAIAGASGQEMVPLRMPSESGEAEENGMWYKPTMLMSVSANTEHPEEAQEFVDFMINSEEAGELNGTDRGLPANENVQSSILDELEGPDLTAAEFVQDIEEEVDAQEIEPVPSMGFSAMQEILQRYETEVFFGRQSSEEAAENMIQEMEAEIESAV